MVLSRGERVNGDGYEWSKQGNLNAAGHWFVSAFNFRPDATPTAGLGRRSDHLGVARPARLVPPAIVGLCHRCYHGCVIGLIGRRIAGDRVGLLAAGTAAVYAGLWIFERALLSETLLLLGISVMILLAYWFRARPSLRGVVLLGGMCGALAMIRSEQVAILPLLILPLIVGARAVSGRRRIVWAGVAVVAMLVVVAPWTIFNLSRFQRPVLLSNGFGGAAAAGNCNLTYYGSEIGYGDLRCVPLFAPGDQSVQDSEDTHTAIVYAEHHASRVPLVLFAREGRTFGFWNPLQTADFDAAFMGTSVGVVRLGMISYWILLVPAAVGTFILRRRRIAVYPLLAFVATSALAVAPAIGDVRYRAAAEVPLVLLAAVAFSAALDRLRRSPSRAIEETPLGEAESVRSTTAITNA